MADPSIAPWIQALVTVLGFTAVSATAYWQLQAGNKQSRARTLVDLMNAWDSPYLDAGKAAFYPMIEAELAKADRPDPGDRPLPNAVHITQAERQRLHETFKKTLGEMKNKARQNQDILRRAMDTSDSQREPVAVMSEINQKQKERLEQEALGYVGLLRLADFFQNIGLLVNRKYVDADDALELYGDHLRAFDCVMRGHLAEMQRKQREQLKDQAPRGGWFYDDFFKLADKAFGGPPPQ